MVHPVCPSYQEGAGSRNHQFQYQKLHKTLLVVVGRRAGDLYDVQGCVKLNRIYSEVFYHNPELGNETWVVDSVFFAEEPCCMQEQEGIDCLGPWKSPVGPFR